MGAEDLLKELGLKIRESDNPERAPIDFTIEDGEDNVAWVWGDNQNSWECECSHPVVEYEDDDTTGQCPLCGQCCDWHYEESADDGYTIKERVPHYWYKGGYGIIDKYIEEKYA